jgi:hypothetical protein
MGYDGESLIVAGESAISSFLRSLCLGLVAFSASTTVAAAPAAGDDDHVSFNAYIRPLFARHCVSCHGGVKQLSGLSFVYREQALAETESGMRAIVPGDPETSYLLERVADPDPEFRMPPAEHGPALSAEEIDLLRRWIEQGAEWEEHWSFVAPRAQEPPAVAGEHVDWPRDPLDRFVLAKLEAAGLAPNPEAERAAWLRRVSLDLTGLPPTPDEYAEFAADANTGAYERVVDRLLASPHFGERWAAMWLDLARYADTQGYEKDEARTIWPYRDWVIRAFNDDLPYDEFTVKQLAGDLLPDATIGDRLATAFHRNTQTNTEGGTDDEEYRTMAVLDRVATTWEAFLGTTFRCAQCHDHPYDPIRNREYYEFVALFNTTRDNDVSEDLPLLAVPLTRDRWELADQYEQRLAENRRAVFARVAPLVGDLTRWHPLRPAQAAGAGDAAFEIRDVQDSPGLGEVVVTGTIAANSEYTVELPLDGVDRLTALRIEALPEDLAAALRTPELGFVLTQLSGEVVSADGTPGGSLRFEAAFADEPEPLFDPNDSFRRNNSGWADTTRMSHPRHAVFALVEPIELEDGDHLRLTLQFHQTAVGDIPLVIRRGRFWAASDPEWTELVADQEFRDLRREPRSLRQQRDRIDHVDVPVMAEQYAPVARRTFAFVRGNWLDKGQEVTAGTPAVFPPLPMRSDEQEACRTRLEMARWIASPDHPLTARVMVNRLWQELFGIGLVETAEDFGTSGTLPSHPELLDHLALRFVNENEWSVKQMLRDVVLSAAYRQAGTITPEKLDADPRNRLLARGPRTRLTAEMVRDQALALSGRMSAKMYGPPVMPPQPEGVWRSVYNGAEWHTADGHDRYRRAVYTFWKRTSGYPSMLTFDAPSRDVCVGRRIATNTPLQALAVMNDEAYIELAVGLAERMQAAEQEVDAQIAAGYRWATGEEIAAPKLLRLRELYDAAAAAFEASPEKGKELATTRDAYALALVASAILNLDEVLTK